MIKFILKLINKTKYLYYVGRHDILPPPLKGREEKDCRNLRALSFTGRTGQSG